MTVYLVNERKGTVTDYPDMATAEKERDDLITLGLDPKDVEIKQNHPQKTDGGTAAKAEPVESEEQTQADDTQAVGEDGKPVKTSATHPDEFDLPDEQPGVDTDPLDWVPSDFVDHIDGQPAINRKGYDVLAHHYDISVTTKVLVSPSETDFEYAEVVATAVTDDGIKYRAHGSADTDRGDDSYLLLEMADTRAAKRATARATGVGMVAVQELKNEL